jgi:hypothetical protein
MAQRIRVGCHIINSAQTPQFLGESRLINVSEGDLVWDVYNSLKDEKDLHLKEVSSGEVTVWKLKTPVVFPYSAKKISELAESLQFCDDEPPPEQASIPSTICQKIDMLLEIEGGQAEWPKGKICLLFQVPDSKCSL